MITIEFTTDNGDFREGDRIRVDENSARVLIERGDARETADEAGEIQEPAVKSGGARARQINRAKAEAEKVAAETDTEE